MELVGGCVENMKKKKFQKETQQYLEYCNGDRFLGFSKKRNKYLLKRSKRWKKL